MNKDDKKIVKNSAKDAITATIIVAFIITIAVCIAGLIFSLPS